jgi:hypothetical protein
MPKMNEISVRFKIDLARGEHLNFSSLYKFRSLRAHFIGQGVAEYSWPGLEDQVFDFKLKPP